jgi:hypothetical protein
MTVKAQSEEERFIQFLQNGMYEAKTEREKNRSKSLLSEIKSRGDGAAAINPLAKADAVKKRLIKEVDESKVEVNDLIALMDMERQETVRYMKRMEKLRIVAGALFFIFIFGMFLYISA